MKKREILLLSGAIVASLALGGLAMVSFRFGNQASLFGSRGDVKNYVLTLDAENGRIAPAGSGYQTGTTNAARTENGNPIEIGYNKAIGAKDEYAQVDKNGGYIYNVSAISGIVYITVNYTSAASLTLITGSSSNPSGNSVSITSGAKVSVGDFSYFKLATGNKYAVIHSIEIGYVCDGNTAPPSPKRRLLA